MSTDMVLGGHDLVERALSFATVSDTVVIVADTSEASLRWAGNSMTTNGVGDSRSWTVVSIVRDGDTARVGTVSSSSTNADDVAGVVRAAEDAARTAQPATDAMQLIAADDAPDDGWGDVAAHTGIDVFDSVVPGLSRGFDGSDPLYGFAHHTVQTIWLGTSSGIRRRFVEPTGSFEINGKRGGLSGGSSAWVGTSTRDFRDVDVDAALGELSRRLDWSARTVELPAGRYETILPPSAVADLMIDLMWSMDGRGAQEGRSALSSTGGTRLGERLGSLGLTLYSDPAEPGLEYAPFVVTGASSDSVSVFDNGMSAGRTDWIRDGAISSLTYPRSAAAEFGTDVTTPGDNLVMIGGSGGSVDDMVARTERGLLLTTLWYIREVDPTTMLLTGLTRDGVYLVEDGRVTAAVNNFRFNESPLDLLRRTTEAGATTPTLPREWSDWFTRAAMPPLRVPDFHMSSVSKAQ